MPETRFLTLVIWSMVWSAWQAGWGVALPKWLHQTPVRPAGVWLACADAKVRRAAILELLPIVSAAEDDPESEHGWPLAQTRADVVVFLCGALQAQLCMSGARPRSVLLPDVPQMVTQTRDCTTLDHKNVRRETGKVILQSDDVVVK